MQVDFSRYLEYPQFVPSVESLLNFDIDKIIAEDPNSSLQYAHTIPYSGVVGCHQIYQYTISKGIPLVITNTMKDWDPNLYTIDFLKVWVVESMEYTQEGNIENHRDETDWTLGRYLEYLDREEREPRYMYGKDIECPWEWRNNLNKKLLKNFVYQSHYDLASNLPEYLRPDNIMVYIGPGGTYTAGHMDLVGSHGNNLMVYSQDENTVSYWFVVPRGFKTQAIQFWHDHGGDIYNESRFLKPSILSKAPFPVYIVKQRVGDFVLVPPESVHQVINTGGVSIKIAWNTITAKSIPISYFSALPDWRKVSKPEIYRIKAIAYFTLKKLMDGINFSNPMDYQGIVDTVSPLLDIFHHIMQSDLIQVPKENNYPFCDPNVDHIPPPKQPHKFQSEFLHDRTCDHCNCDIFNRCYHCPVCTGTGGKDYCFDCVSLGFGCEDHFKHMIIKEFVLFSKLQKELSSYYKIFTKLLKNAGKSTKEINEILQTKTTKIIDSCGFLSTATVAYHVVYFSK
eukprot:gene8438-10364_t